MKFALPKRKWNYEINPLGEPLIKKSLITLSLIGTLFLTACGSSTSTMGMSDSSISSMPATGEMMVENKVSIDRSIIKTSSSKVLLLG